MQVTDLFWQEGQHLSFTLFATSFNSDPDLYISKVTTWFYLTSLYSLCGHTILAKLTTTVRELAVTLASFLQAISRAATISTWLLSVWKRALMTSNHIMWMSILSHRMRKKLTGGMAPAPIFSNIQCHKRPLRVQPLVVGRSRLTLNFSSNSFLCIWVWTLISILLKKNRRPWSSMMRSSFSKLV